ncbi:MAG: GNAT family N-acetyltransferase [Planctomycetes bacterium]|nr:GNAT family N-acetyltransferase [Planctomycetota bacterium]
MPDTTIRPFRESDIPDADRIFRLSFGTFLGMSDPAKFGGDADWIKGRFRTEPLGAFTAERGGKIIGSNFVVRWGKLAFFGPLSVHPDHWDNGAAQLLLTSTMKLFERWKLTHSGLFTFANSPKHVGLYQKFGYFPRYLTPVFSHPSAKPARPTAWTAYSTIPAENREDVQRACRVFANSLLSGLDLASEMQTLERLRLGETIIIGPPTKPDAFAVCHLGPKSEAGSGVCYVKFGAAKTANKFERLIEAVEAFAAERNLATVTFGVNAGRTEAYRAVVKRGYRADKIQGVIMERGGRPGYNRPGMFILDDWR